MNPVVARLKESRILYIDKPVCPLAKDDVIVDAIRYKNTLDAYYLIEKRTIVNN